MEREEELPHELFKKDNDSQVEDVDACLAENYGHRTPPEVGVEIVVVVEVPDFLLHPTKLVQIFIINVSELLAEELVNILCLFHFLTYGERGLTEQLIGWSSIVN